MWYFSYHIHKAFKFVELLILNFTDFAPSGQVCMTGLAQTLDTLHTH